jgi:hypothetical protein
MATISSLQIGGVTYDIYAKSAEQAPVGSHELSSHSHFSTYFNGTSANTALTAKYALSADYAKSASQGFGILATATSTAVTGTNTTIGSVVNPKLVFSNSGQNQKGFIIWSDYNAANAWSGDASAYFGGAAISDGFVLTSDQGNSITLAKNLSATNFKATKISATNITATTFSGNLSGTATSAGAAPLVGHNHGMMVSSFIRTLNADTSVSTWSGQFGVLNDGYWLYSIRGQSTAPSWFAPNFAAGIAFGGADTKGVISVQYDSPKIKIAGGNGKTSAGAPVWWIGLNGTNGKTYTLPGDTSTLAATTGSYTALSAGYATATNTAQTMKSALSAGIAEKVQMQAKSDNTWYQSLFASTSTSSIWYDSDSKVQYNPSSNTFSSTNLYGTTVSGATISGTNITAATTVRGTNISGTNISGATKTATIDNLITSASRSIPSVGNGTITINTGSTTATGTFTTNQNTNTTITLGSMALTQTGTYFSGTSALSALTSKSALSAGSATTAANASTAANANKGVWAEVTDNRNYPVAISLDSKFNYTTTGGANYIYFNPASGQLNVVSAVKIGGCQMKWNSSTSALDFNF